MDRHGVLMELARPQTKASTERAALESATHSSQHPLFRAGKSFLVVIICLVAPLLVAAQQGGTSRYVYDDNGRLRAVVAPTGEAAVYDYDPAGNPTGIRRLAANQVTVLDLSPKMGAEGDRVQVVGVGFGPTVASNAVAFNGATATVVEASPTMIVVTVPAAATTGLLTVTAPNGTATSPVPFTIVPRLRVTPPTALLLPGASLQFTATPLSLPGGTSVVWSAGGVVGGDANVGTISASGLYEAPAVPLPSVIIRAASAADPNVFGEARVNITDFAGFSAAAAVSVQFGPQTGRVNAAVSAVRGVYLASITPANLPRGATTTVTINGQSLAGATAVQFLLSSGPPDSQLTASNIQVNAEGTQLTATVTVSPFPAPGKRIVTVTAAAGRSTSVDLGNNTIQVVP